MMIWLDSCLNGGGGGYDDALAGCFSICITFHQSVVRALPSARLRLRPGGSVQGGSKAGGTQACRTNTP